MTAYTPFLADVGQMLGAGERRRTEADLAGSAYMGDQRAMQQLMRTNPQLGIQIQNKKRQEKQQKLQQQTAKRDIYTENRELMDGIFKEAAKIEDFEQAKAYIQRRFDENEPILGDMGDSAAFTPEVHTQIKAVYGEGDEEDPVQRSVDIPGEGTKIIRKSGEVEFKPASVEGRQAFIRSQETEVKQAATKAEKVEAAKLSSKAKQELKNEVNKAAFAAREQMPRIENLEELASIADTGTFGELRTSFKRAFGVDIANEEEFMAESNRVILDAAASLKGALSDRENEYLEAVGPGIGKSREGNLRIIKNLKIITQNSIDRQKALKEFKGDPVDFNFQGKSFSAVTVTEPTSEQIYINPKTGEKGQIVDGKWQTI